MVKLDCHQNLAVLLSKSPKLGEAKMSSMNRFFSAFGVIFFAMLAACEVADSSSLNEDLSNDAIVERSQVLASVTLENGGKIQVFGVPGKTGADIHILEKPEYQIKGARRYLSAGDLYSAYTGKMPPVELQGPDDIGDPEIIRHFLTDSMQSYEGGGLEPGSSCETAWCSGDVEMCFSVSNRSIDWSWTGLQTYGEYVSWVHNYGSASVTHKVKRSGDWRLNQIVPSGWCSDYRSNTIFSRTYSHYAIVNGPGALFSSKVRANYE